MKVGDKKRTDDKALPSDAEPVRRRIRAIGRRLRRRGNSWRAIMLTALCIAVTASVIGVYYVEYRPDRQTDSGAAQQVIQAASEGAVALLSYSPDSLSRNFADAKSRLTDDFRDYYQRFTEQIVAPTAQRGLTTTVRVVRAAISEIHPNSAVVLVFIDQTTASKDAPRPAKTGSSVQVTLNKVKGSWLIAKFDAV